MASASLVSVIIPAYNAERYLGLTLASVQAQTYKNLEILVVDDGSSDSTATIVEIAARTDGRIRLIRQPNLGVAVARNTALQQARGEFIAPVDADDLWHPQNVALQVAALQKAGPNVAVSYGWFVNINGDGEFCGAGPRSRFTHKQDVLSAELKGNFIGNSSSTVMRKAAVEAVGGYDATLRARNAEGCEDQAIYISLARRWDYTFVSHYLIAYRVHPESMSQDTERMARSQALVLSDVRRVRPRLPGHWFSRGIARIYEGPLVTALLRRQWRVVTTLIKCSGSFSLWALVQLLGVRMPVRISGFFLRRLRRIASQPEREKETIRAFWLAEDKVRGSTEFFFETQSSIPQPDRSRA